MDFLGYLGVRGRRRVFGLWNETEVRFLVLACALVPWRAAFLAALALAFLAAAAGAAAFAFELFVAAIADGRRTKGTATATTRGRKSGRLIGPGFVYRDSKLRFGLRFGNGRRGPNRAITGRDLFAIVTYGARTSLGIGLAATAMSIVIGVLVGVTTGFLGGWYDRVLSRVVDVIFGFPSLVFMIALTAVVPTSFPKPLLVVLVIGFFGWPSVARVVRGQTLSLVSRNYVVASTAMGAGRWHVIRKQLLPNLAATITVYATISIPSMIGAEAALSFLAVGVTPPTPSWGRSIGDAIGWVQTDPMYLVFPGAALFLVTLAFNVLGDALRDALDPRGGAR